MDKNAFAPVPPMGWNSYDYYDTAVTEDRVRANAEFMAERLKPYGWEYVVVDIQWYARGAGSMRDRFQYLPFDALELDGYSRLQPCPARFPSSANGKGFKPLADYVHGLGLKFGIHIMRGIPRVAAHSRSPLYGTGRRADEIADPSSICAWNPDMYGVFPEAPGAREYYDSIFRLYAEWGVDFVKCDDICRMDAKSSRAEIVLLHDAIQKCGRPMALSLSPGPALVGEASHYAKYANMWRITDDLWDAWPHVLAMFDRCELWQGQVAEGSWPDCDMLPLGTIGKGFGDERKTRLDPAERQSLMTLWCVFRSPLMLGAELTLLDGDTLSLLTNRKVLRLVTHGRNPRQAARGTDWVVWLSDDSGNGALYLAAFNLGETEREVPFGGILDGHTGAGQTEAGTGVWTELWTAEPFTGPLHSVTIESHGCRLYKIDRNAE